MFFTEDYLLKGFRLGAAEEGNTIPVATDVLYAENDRKTYSYMRVY